MLNKRIFAFLALFFVMITTPAAVVKNLASADVIVADRSQQSLDAALPNALAQVLIKLSGNNEIATVPAVASQLNSASQWLRGYSYKSDDDGLHLIVNFNEQPLYQLLRQTGQTLWGRDRPLVLAWYEVIPYQQSTELLVADSQYASQLSSAMQRRGLANMLPMGDLDDQAVLENNTNWPPSKQSLQALRQRYGVDSVNIVRLQEVAPNQWQGSELLDFNDNNYTWTLSGDSVPDLIASAVTNMSDTMANQLAVLQTKGLRQDLKVAVRGVKSLTQMQSIISYLNRLTAVDRLTVLGIGESGLILDVNAAGGREPLVRALARSRHLAVMQPSGDDSANTLVLQWRG